MQGNLVRITLCATLLTGCVLSDQTKQVGQTVPNLPLAMSNNAVAMVEKENTIQWFSFLGLASGKTYADVGNRAFAFDSRSGIWRRLPDVPGPPRIAATAQAINGLVYIFGGYTVAPDHTETSVPLVLAFDPDTNQYTEMPAMPIPVDDAVSAVYANRYIYLVSGWHDTDNVAAVQVFDTQSQQWRLATPFPGAPVFGHAGGLVKNTLVVCDGVTVQQPVPPETARSFALTNACFKGDINPGNPTSIQWSQLPPHPGVALYRSAAAGDSELGQIIFAGGSSNPYNYNGIGYDGEPSHPVAHVFWYALDCNCWRQAPAKTMPTMDHRGLVRDISGKWWTIGGMKSNQEVHSLVSPAIQSSHQ